MAEVIVNTIMGDDWLAVSAGTKPTGYIHPKAIEVLEEINIYHSGKSKSVGLYKDWKLDLIVTVCDQAAEECPTWLFGGKQAHIGFTDPALAKGSDDAITKVFRDVRDDIKERILALLKEEIAIHLG